jgi:hypothetical protein
MLKHFSALRSAAESIGEAPRAGLGAGDIATALEDKIWDIADQLG